MDRNFVVTALRNGFSDSQIAQSLGVTQSAVAQAIESYGLKEIAAQNSKFESIDAGLNDLEELVVKKLKTSMGFAVLTPMQLASILRTVNGAKRRSGGEGGPNIGIHTQLVNLNLPQRREVAVTKSALNEVIEVEGRVLQTLPSGKLSTMAQESARISREANLPTSLPPQAQKSQETSHETSSKESSSGGNRSSTPSKHEIAALI